MLFSPAAAGLGTAHKSRRLCVAALRRSRSARFAGRTRSRRAFLLNCLPSLLPLLSLPLAGSRCPHRATPATLPLRCPPLALPLEPELAPNANSSSRAVRARAAPLSLFLCRIGRPPLTISLRLSWVRACVALRRTRTASQSTATVAPRRPCRRPGPAEVAFASFPSPPPLPFNAPSRFLPLTSASAGQARP